MDYDAVLATVLALLQSCPLRWGKDVECVAGLCYAAAESVRIPRAVARNTGVTTLVATGRRLDK